MKDYSSMSDFEINKAVFVKKQYYDEVIDKPVRDGASVHCGDGCNWREFDPCNNPADAWPIIVENGITLAFQDGNWWADNLAYWIDGVEWSIGGIIDKNPLRAAMIVFLMMKDGEND